MTKYVKPSIPEPFLSQLTEALIENKTRSQTEVIKEIYPQDVSKGSALARWLETRGYRLVSKKGLRNPKARPFVIAGNTEEDATQNREKEKKSQSDIKKHQLRIKQKLKRLENKREVLDIYEESLTIG